MALNLNRTKIARTIIVFAAICGTLGAIDFFKPASLAIYALQTKAKTVAVSGDIVVVGIDSSSINEIGRWPWPREKQAELLEKIDQHEPKEVYLDIGYQGRTNSLSDAKLKRTIETMRAPISVIALASENDERTIKSTFSHPAAVGQSQTVSSSFPYLFGFVWELPTIVQTEKGPLKSVAASIAAVNLTHKNFRIDYRLDPGTIPTIPAKDVMTKLPKSRLLYDKTVVIGVTDMTQNDVHSMPGWGRRPGVIFHVIGAETLKSGIPVEWGWTPAFAIALILSGLMLSKFGLRYSRPISWFGNVGIMVVSTWLTTIAYGNNPLPAMMLLGATGFYISRQKLALIRSTRNQHTGFTNMTGYMVDEVVSNAWFIGASLHQPQTRLGYILDADNIKIMREVGRRLSTVIDEKQLTHNEAQQFLWEMPPVQTSKLGDHLEGLRQLFAEPLNIDGRKIDVDIFFGVDRDINANVTQRMLSALSASEIAKQMESTFKIATEHSFDEHFKTHFDQEFHLGATEGDVTILLQAQQELADGRVHSAEASLSWTHPSYGKISTKKLFELAKASGSLPTVTDFLCKQAINEAARLGRIYPGFAVSIKISAEIAMASRFGSAMRVAAEQAQCQVSNITFIVIGLHDHTHNQVTEEALAALQKVGFRIAIGEFGTTSSDLDLLKFFSPDEIVLSKSFSAELLGSTSNQIFADSVLRIASGKHIVSTADGIDDRDVLKELTRRSCDRGMGKIISMPLSFKYFVDTHLVKHHKMNG